MGYEYDEKSNKFRDRETKTVIEGIDDNAIRMVVASSRADSGTINKLAGLENILELGELSKALSEDGSQLDSKLARDIIAAGDNDEELLKVLVGGADISKITDEDKELILDQARQNAKIAEDRTVKQRKDLVRNMAKYSGEGFEDDAQFLRVLEGTYGEDVRSVL
jgi:hypothetical protein